MKEREKERKKMTMAQQWGKYINNTNVDLKTRNSNNNNNNHSKEHRVS